MNYYSEILNSNMLKQCYTIANARVRQYLEAEILFVLDRIDLNSVVLELGCGYGRVASRLLPKAKEVVGVDISAENIKLANAEFKYSDSINYYEMNAADLGFPDEYFDSVICVQNGISAFNIAPTRMISEALRVTKYGGTVLLSTYSDKFWDERLNWFRMQADAGLVGEIDYDLTSAGTIRCKDGFRATTFTRNDFIELAEITGTDAEVFEVDESAIFCEFRKR